MFLRWTSVSHVFLDTHLNLSWFKENALKTLEWISEVKRQSKGMKITLEIVFL